MAALLLAATVARAQYYSWGADAASLRWRTIRTPDVQVIFPDTAGAIARRTLHFIEAAQPSIGYGFRRGTRSSTGGIRRPSAFPSPVLSETVAGLSSISDPNVFSGGFVLCKSNKILSLATV